MQVNSDLKHCTFWQIFLNIGKIIWRKCVLHERRSQTIEEAHTWIFQHLGYKKDSCVKCAYLSNVFTVQIYSIRIHTRNKVLEIFFKIDATKNFGLWLGLVSIIVRNYLWYFTYCNCGKPCISDVCSLIRITLIVWLKKCNRPKV